MQIDSIQTFTKGGKLRHTSPEIMCRWEIKAWNYIKPHLIQKSFKICNISYNLDVTKDSYLFMDQSKSDGVDKTVCDDVP